MTSEQIAELRETLRAENTPVWGVTDGKTVTWTTTLDVSEKITLALRRWLPRLLDEREALLEALKRALVELGDARSTLSHCWASEVPPEKDDVDAVDHAQDAIDAAIAKAESP